MFENTLYFCFGDYRDGTRRYRIFPVDSVAEAHRAAETLGYRILLDEAPKFEGISDMEERLADAVLSSIHLKLHGIENTVSCVRTSGATAAALERHFMEADIRDYFPKILDKPIDLGESNHPVLISRRPCPWMLDHVECELRTTDRVIPKVASLQVCHSRQSALGLEETASDFLQAEEERRYDGIVTAVVHEEGLKRGYLNLSNYLDWIRVIVELIGHTTSRTGLKVYAMEDENTYPTKRKFTEEQMKELNVAKDKTLGKWNYKITPR